MQCSDKVTRVLPTQPLPLRTNRARKLRHLQDFKQGPRPGLRLGPRPGLRLGPRPGL